METPCKYPFYAQRDVHLGATAGGCLAWFGLLKAKQCSTHINNSDGRHSYPNSCLAMVSASYWQLFPPSFTALTVSAEISSVFLQSTSSL